MLLKLFVDDTFPFAEIKSAKTVNWIVQDNLALNHPQNIESMMRAIGAPRKQGSGEPFGNTYLHAGGRGVELGRSAPDNNLMHGANLTFSLTKPMAANTPRSFRANTQSSARFRNDDDDDNEYNDNESDGGSEAGDSPRGSRSGTMNSARSRASSRGSSIGGDNEEIYTAPECGWFPFVVSSGPRKSQSQMVPNTKNNNKSGGKKSNGGTPSDAENKSGGNSAAATPRAGGENESEPPESPMAKSTSGNKNVPNQTVAVGPRVAFNPRNITSVRCMNSYDEPEPEDPEPRTFDLCQKCTDLVVGGVQKNLENVTHVERHYRPMMVDTETISVWLEKKGGSVVSRWQRRWFMFTEKSIDYAVKQPNFDEREVWSGSIMINVEGKFTITKIVEHPTPEEYPEVGKSAAGAYYFVIHIDNYKKGQMFCKAATENDRKTVCAFLNKLKGRAEQSGGNTRDPVTWKQWANSLLVSTSNMAELRVAKEEEYEDLEKEIAGIKSEIDGLNAGRDQTKANLAYQRGLVDRLEKELLMATRKNAELDRSTKEVRASVDGKREELSHSLEQSEETSHRAKILEQEAIAEKKRAILALHEMREENERIQQKIEELFSKWRRVEEHHVESAFRPSTLAPADIAARAARDYENRNSNLLGSTSGNNTNRSIGPMQPLTADTFSTPSKSARSRYNNNNNNNNNGNNNNYVPELSPSAFGSTNNLNLDESSASSSTPASTSRRIEGSTLSSPNARLHSAVKDLLEEGSALKKSSGNSSKVVDVKEASKQSGNRITFGISAALGYTPGSRDALSSSRSRRR